MAKWIVLLIALLCSQAHSETKQEIFFNSCVKSYSTALSLLSKQSDAKNREFSVKMCNIARDRWQKENKFASMDDPKGLGCWNAMEMVYDPDTTNREFKVKSLQRFYCADKS